MIIIKWKLSKANLIHAETSISFAFKIMSPRENKIIKIFYIKKYKREYVIYTGVRRRVFEKNSGNLSGIVQRKHNLFGVYRNSRWLRTTGVTSEVFFKLQLYRRLFCLLSFFFRFCSASFLCFPWHKFRVYESFSIWGRTRNVRYFQDLLRIPSTENIIEKKELIPLCCNP